MRFHFFSQPHENGPYTSIWEVTDGRAVRLGIANPETVKNSSCMVKPGQSGVEAIRELLNNMGFGECSHWPLELEPGQYYPRIARPGDQHFQQFPGNYPGAINDAHAIAMSLGQLNVLTRQLAEICQTVHPANNTLETYGHSIRNLLILACTEVEAHWRGILIANDIKQKRYTTATYVQILAAMRLDEYSLGYPYYPWLNTRGPFHGWNSITPTESLSWYDAYNAVKHDREGSFYRATLGHAFDAVGACVILMLAQYGHTVDNWQESETARFFRIDKRPSWVPSEVYTFDYNNAGAANKTWTPVPFPFAK